MIKQNSTRAWIAAIRPKTLSAAMIPILLGSSLAYYENRFQWQPTIICLLFSLLMQIDANFINDLFDYKKGVDGEERLGPPRTCSQGWISISAMKKAILVTTIIGSMVGAMILFYTDWKIIFIGAICILFAFLYTAGPYPLAYHGWGDILVLVFFGFIPVGFTYYIQAGNWTILVFIVSLICGLSINTLLAINNYRDRETDAKKGKRTLVVLWGETFGKYLYLLLGITSSLLCLIFLIQDNWWAALLPQIYLIPHIRTWKKMIKINKGKELNTILGETSVNIIIIGVLLSIGLILGRAY